MNFVPCVPLRIIRIRSVHYVCVRYVIDELLCNVLHTYYSSGNSVAFCCINRCICTVFCFNVFHVQNFANSRSFCNAVYLLDLTGFYY